MKKLYTLLEAQKLWKKIWLSFEEIEWIKRWLSDLEKWNIYDENEFYSNLKKKIT